MNNITALHDARLLRGRLADRIARIARAIAVRYDRHIALKELSALDDRLLDDIGLTRGELNATTFKRAHDSGYHFHLHDGRRC